MYRPFRSLFTILALCALAFPARAQYVVKQSTAYTVTLPDIVASSDHISGLTAQTGTVYLTRVTGSSGAITKAASTNNISEVDSVNAPGQYTLTLTATETGALGYIKGYYKAASSDPVSFTIKIVAYNPDDASLLGLTGVGTLANQTSIKAKTDLIATNAADSPNEQTAQTNAGTAATQSTAANGKLLGNIAAQSGDAYARLGAPTGASLSADFAALSAKFGTPVGASFSADIAGIPVSVWANGTRTLSAFAFQPTIGGYASGQDPASSVWNALTASFQTNNTFGKYVSGITGGGGGDPFALTKGSYSAGTWGAYLSGNLPATVQGYASGQDPATLLKATTINGRTFAQLLSILGVSPAGTISSITRTSSAPWRQTIVYTDGAVTATYVSEYTNNTFSVQSGRPTVTFTGL